MTVKAGDRFRIRARFDKGGYPVIEVREVFTNGAARVQAYSTDGRPMYWGGEGEQTYVIQDARYTLAKYWKRERERRQREADASPVVRDLAVAGGQQEG